MITLLTIGLTLCVCMLLFLTWLGKRNNKVAEFRNLIVKLDKRIVQKHIKVGGTFNGFSLYSKLPSYDKQLFSIKKLTIENYYNVDDQALLNTALEVNDEELC